MECGNIRLTARVRTLLEMRYEVQGKPNDGWVFSAPTKSGRVESVKSQHRAALKDSGVKPFVLYSLRHTTLRGLASPVLRRSRSRRSPATRAPSLVSDICTRRQHSSKARSRASRRTTLQWRQNWIRRSDCSRKSLQLSLQGSRKYKAHSRRVP